MKIVKNTSLLCILLLLAAMSSAHKTHAMEQQASEQPLFRDFAEYIGNILLGNIQFEPTEFSGLTQLPPEDQSKIASLLLIEKSSDTLEMCGKTINALAQVNKELNELINNPDFCLKLIKHLAQRFNCSDQKIAEVLQTKEAKQRLEIQKKFLTTISQPKFFNAQEFNHLYETYKEYVDLNFTFYIFNKNKRKDVTLLMLAVRNKSCPAISMILKCGANINEANNSEKETALLAAAIRTNDNVIKCLLNDPNIAIDQQDSKGMTALMKAALNNNPMMQLLIKYGADVNKVNSKGLTALMLAATHGHKSAVECLLDVPTMTTIDQKSSDGSTALMLATIINNCPVINLIIKHRANINEVNSKGLTALMLAVIHKYSEAVKCLLDAPTMTTTINKQNSKGETALMMAILLGDKLIIKQLLDAGANPEIADTKGLTPLQAAQQTGDQEIIDLVQKAIDKKHRKTIQ